MGRLLVELLEPSRIGRVVADLVARSLTGIAKQAVQMAETGIYAIVAEMIFAAVIVDDIPKSTSTVCAWPRFTRTPI